MILFCFVLIFFFFSPKQKASNYDLLDMEGHMLPEKLHFIGVAERDELLVKMPVWSFPSPPHWQVTARHRFNLPLCLEGHKPPTWQMLLPWCYPGSPSNPPVGALLLGLKFLNNNVLTWWFWCLSGR